MLYRDICKALGFYLFGLAAALSLPLLLAFYYQFIADPLSHPQPHSTLAFLGTITVCMALGFCFYRAGKLSEGQLYRREALATVAIIWFLTPALSALPFLMNGTLSNPLQAYFETTSGFTTTGSTTLQAKQFDPVTGKEIPIKRTIFGVIPINYTFYGTVDPVRNPITNEIEYEGIEAVSKALLFWRSFTQWLGGMGIIVLFVAILPVLGMGGRVLFQAEAPGPNKDSLTPRIKETAIQLWKIYLGLTIVQIILLMVTNAEVKLLDATTITFSTLSTGGLSIRNENIGAYHNVYTESIVILFMLLGSINFALYFYMLKGKLYRIYEMEFFLYLIILCFGGGLASWHLVGAPKILLSGGDTGTLFTAGEAMRYGIFQIVSAQTSTGFATANYDAWPYIVQILMLILMFVGGMSGSTSGGIKIIRHYMLFRIAQYRIESLFRPETVRQFRISGREVDNNAATMVLCFFLIIISFSVFSTFLFVLDGIDLETSIGVVACMVNNVGLGFRMAGPTESCAFLSNFGLILSSILMILGRLEFFAILAVLVPAFWRQNN